MQRVQILALTKLCEEQRQRIEELERDIERCDEEMRKFPCKSKGYWCKSCREFCQVGRTGVACAECDTFVCHTCIDFVYSNWHLATESTIFPLGAKAHERDWIFRLCGTCAKLMTAPNRHWSQYLCGWTSLTLIE